MYQIFIRKIPVVAKSRVVERLCQEIGMLLIRLYMGNGKLPLKNKLPQKVVAYVDVLRV